MNQFLPILSKEISRFDSLSGLLIRAVLKSDPQNTFVFQVWLLPESAEAFTTEMLKFIGVCTEELAQLFDPSHCSARRACHAYKMQQEMITSFAPELERPHFYYTPYISPDGLVVRVVFGIERDIQAFKEIDFDLEPSD